ncbi:MAG: DedA family protein, partial [Sphingomonas sp.]
FFMKRGGWVIFVFRFMPTFRTVISLPAGMTRMPIWQFVIWTAAGSAIWNTVLTYAGILLGSHFEELDRYVGPVAVATFVVIIIGYGWRVLTWKPKG